MPSVTKASASATTTSTTAPSFAPAPIPTGYDPNRNAASDIAAALKLAKQSHRTVVLDFGADWCPDCLALDHAFASATVKPALQKSFIVVPIDVGQFDHNMDLSKAYGDAAKIGIPGLAVLDSSGKMLAATSDGSFADARTMSADQVKAYLDKWLPAVP